MEPVKDVIVFIRNTIISSLVTQKDYDVETLVLLTVVSKVVSKFDYFYLLTVVPFFLGYGAVIGATALLTIYGSKYWRKKPKYRMLKLNRAKKD